MPQETDGYGTFCCPEIHATTELHAAPRVLGALREAPPTSREHKAAEGPRNPPAQPLTGGPRLVTGADPHPSALPYPWKRNGTDTPAAGSLSTRNHAIRGPTNGGGGGGGRVSGKGGRTYPSRGTVRGAACGPVRGQDKRPLLQRPAPPSPPLPSGRAGDRAASPPPLPAGHSQLQAGVGRRCRRSCRRRHPSPPSGRRRLGSASFSPPPLPPVRTD